MIMEARSAMVALAVQRTLGAMSTEAMGLKISKSDTDPAPDRRVRWSMEIRLFMFMARFLSLNVIHETAFFL